MKIQCIILFMAPALVLAMNKPIALAADHRIKLVDYSQNNVVPIYGVPLTTTQLIFAKQQYIVDVQGGDAGGWSPYWDKAIPYVLNLKLTAQHSDSNMTVITKNLQTHKVYFYYFHLQSTDAQDDMTYAIRFNYPQQKTQQLNAKLKLLAVQKNAEISTMQNPRAYHWGYTFSGDKSIMPLHIFDDGKFTYMQLQPNQSVPAVFAVFNKDGKESVVNYRRDGSYLIVNTTAPQFTLRQGGDHEVSIFNKRLIREKSS